MKLGQIRALQGRPAEALEQYERELAFLRRVDHALKDRAIIELHARIGSAHLALGHADEARRPLMLSGRRPSRTGSASARTSRSRATTSPRRGLSSGRRSGRSTFSRPPRRCAASTCGARPHRSGLREPRERASLHPAPRKLPSPGERGAQPVSLAQGTRLGPVRDRLGPLGAGGMGEVYRARDTKLGRDVAIKVLPEELFEDEETDARASRGKPKRLRALNHPEHRGIYSFEEIPVPGFPATFSSWSCSRARRCAERLEGRSAAGAQGDRHRARRSREASPRHTRRGSSTGTSSPRTSSSRRTATSRSSTSAWRARSRCPRMPAIRDLRRWRVRPSPA